MTWDSNSERCVCPSEPDVECCPDPWVANPEYGDVSGAEPCLCPLETDENGYCTCTRPMTTNDNEDGCECDYPWAQQTRRLEEMFLRGLNGGSDQCVCDAPYGEVDGDCVCMPPWYDEVDSNGDRTGECKCPGYPFDSADGDCTCPYPFVHDPVHNTCYCEPGYMDNGSGGCDEVCVLDESVLTNSLEYNLAKDVGIDFPDGDTIKFTTHWTGSLLKPTTGAESIEVIVFNAYSDGTCDYQHIWGKTSGADASRPNNAGSGSSLLHVDNFDPGDFQDGNTAVSFEMDPQLWHNGEGINYVEANGKGHLRMCVEVQQHACDAKQDFQTLFLKIMVDLDSECDNCQVATVEKDDPVVDTAEIDAPDVECRLGNPPGGDPANPYKNGDPIEVCVRYVMWENADDGLPLRNPPCFKEFLSFTGSFFNVAGPVELLDLPDGTGWTEVGTSKCHPVIEPGTQGTCRFERNKRGVI